MGQLDLTRTSPSDLSTANTLLNPTLKLLHIDDPTTFWLLVNWVLVGYYWTVLNDLGQISPTIYAPIPSQPLPDWYQVNFSQATSLPSTNNIFVNETLFDHYSAYLRDVILPELGLLHTPGFPTITFENQLKPRVITFVRSYTCQIRAFKSPLEAIVSIAASIYVFTATSFNIALIIAGIARKRYRPNRGYVFWECNLRGHLSSGLTRLRKWECNLRGHMSSIWTSTAAGLRKLNEWDRWPWNKRRLVDRQVDEEMGDEIELAEREGNGEHHDQRNGNQMPNGVETGI